MRAFDWNPLRSCFDGTVFNSAQEIPDEELRYAIQTFRFSMTIKEPNKDKQLEAYHVWNTEARRRRLVVGPRRLLPWTAAIHGKEGVHFVGVSFTCPACQILHCVNTEFPNAIGARFSWDGSWEEPTITEPVAILKDKKLVCAFQITKGIIAFSENCDHELAGASVELEEV